MYMIRFHIVAFLCLWPLLAISQSHDFEVRDFHENTADLSAVSPNVKDLNGRTAALIRFAVRDTLFSFEANNGIIKQNKAIGEVLLYVPQGTKRITIRHPQLGILRNYQLPLSLESKSTYDAEIVITNASYLQKLIGGGLPSVETKAPFETEPEKRKEEVLAENSVVDNVFQRNAAKQKRSHAPLDVHFFVSGGFNALTVMGANISAGVHLEHLVLSADYTVGMNKVEGVGIYYKISSYGEIGEAYDYSASRFTVRLGYNTNPKGNVHVVPQVGASFTMIKGDEIVNKLDSEAQFANSNPLSLSLALSLRIKLFNPLFVYVTPQYDLAVGADDVYKVIKDADSKIKAWGEGFGVCAGLLLQF